MTTTSEHGRRHRQKTRVVHLDAGQTRDHDHDVRTVMGGLRAFADGPPPFRSLFIESWDAIRDALYSFEDPGVVVVAVDAQDRAVSVRGWVSGRPGVLTSAIVGRHSRADFLLDDDPTVSLRHLAVLVHPLSSWEREGVTFRLLDLRTGLAFRDERGEHLEAVVADGPLFVTCGRYALFLLRTGGRPDWPMNGRHAWEGLPPRMFVDSVAAEPDRWDRHSLDPRPDPGPAPARFRPVAESRITLVSGPVPVNGEMVRQGEDVVGVLSLETRQGSQAIPVGRSACERGILLGRSLRCDASGLLADPTLSRSHVLIMEVERKLYAIDTGSTAGTFRIRSGGRKKRVRCVPLGDRASLVLGKERGMVHWRGSQRPYVH